jgi:hypothetical protein
MKRKSCTVARSHQAALRAARPRTFDHVCDLLVRVLGLVTAEECAHYLRHCGYSATTGQ